MYNRTFMHALCEVALLPGRAGNMRTHDPTILSALARSIALRNESTQAYFPAELRL